MLTISEFSAAILFEVVFVLLLMAGYYYFKKKKLIGSTNDTKNTADEASSGLSLIEQKIRELEGKKSEFLAAEPADQRSVTVCEYWLNILNAEKHALEVAESDRDLFWLTAINHTDTSLLAGENNQAEDDSKAADQAEEIAKQAEQIASLTEQIARQTEEMTSQAEKIASQAEENTTQAGEIAEQGEEITKQAQSITSQAEEIASQVEEITMLKESVKNNELQIKNLETFRSLFFDLKKNLDELERKNAGIVAQIDVDIPDADKSDTLKRLLADAQQEKEQLQQRVFSIEQELTSLLKHVAQVDFGDDNSNAMAKEQRSLNPEELLSSIKSGADKFKQVVAKQKLEIAELNNQVNRMHMEVEERNQLVKQIQEIQQKGKELEDVLIILEDENGFLQKQIQELLSMGNAAPVTNDGEVQVLKQKLHTKEKESIELTQKFSSLEMEYLAVYAEAEALKKKR